MTKPYHATSLKSAERQVRSEREQHLRNLRAKIQNCSEPIRNYVRARYAMRDQISRINKP